MVEDPKAQTRKRELLVQLDRRVTLLKMAAPPTGPLRDAFDEEVAAIKEGLGELEQDFEEPRRWWFTELWFEKRELFKEGVAHVVVFAALLGSLELAHRLLAKSSLPAEELHLLNKAHFYMYAISLVDLRG